MVKRLFKCQEDPKCIHESNAICMDCGADMCMQHADPHEKFNCPVLKFSKAQKEQADKLFPVPVNG